MDQTTKDLLEAINFIKEKAEQLPTKDDVRDITREVIRQEVPGMIREELKPIHHELKEINRRLDTLDEEYKNLKGVTKEIDEIREQVRAIEKHLGMNKKIAA